MYPVQASTMIKALLKTFWEGKNNQQGRKQQSHIVHEDGKIGWIVFGSYEPESCGFKNGFKTDFDVVEKIPGGDEKLKKMSL